MGEILTVVVPLYLLIVVGLLAGRTRTFDGAAGPLNRYVYYFAIPAFLFTAIVDAPRGLGLPVGFYLVALLGTVGISSLVYVAAANSRWASQKRPLALVTGFGNIGYFGLPIVLGVLGPGSGLAVAVLVLLYNLVYLLGYPLLASFNDNINVRKALVQSGLKNPLFGAALVGFAIYFANLQVPAFLGNAIGWLSDSTIPVALVAIGLALGSLLRQPRGGAISWPQVVFVVVVKHLIVPLLTWAACFVLLPGADRIVWAALVLMAAMPTGVSSYTMAQEFDPDPRPVAVVVATSTLVALVTVPLFILLVA